MKMNSSALASERVSNKMFIRLFILALVLLPNVSFAQSLRIAIVDVEKVSSQSMAGKSIQKQLKERRAAFQKEFSAREDNLMNAEKLLIEQKGDLSNEEFTKKRKEFETQLLETRNLFQKRRNSLDKGVSAALAQLRKTIVEVTAEISERDNYNVVLTRDSVVLVETEMDITEKVMTEMNTRLPNISLKIEE